MLDFLKSLFGFSTKPVTVADSVPSAPYKVPEPAATTPTPLVVETVAPVAETAPAKKAPAKKATAKAPAKPKAEPKPKATAKTAKAKAPAKPKITVAK